MIQKENWKISFEEIATRQKMTNSQPSEITDAQVLLKVQQLKMISKSKQELDSKK